MYLNISSDENSTNMIYVIDFISDRYIIKYSLVSIYNNIYNVPTRILSKLIDP